MKNHQVISFYFLVYLIKKYGFSLPFLSKEQFDEKKNVLKKILMDLECTSSLNKLNKFIRDLSAAHFRFLNSDLEFEVRSNDSLDDVYPVAHCLLILVLEDYKKYKEISLTEEINVFFENLESELELKFDKQKYYSYLKLEIEKESVC